MARTLSTTRPAPTETKSRAQDEVLAIIWSCLCEMWLIGERLYGRPARDGLPARKGLVIPHATLKAQLEAPDAWKSPYYANASERFRDWSSELDRHNRRVAVLLGNLATHYGALSRRNRLELVSGKGWSQAVDPKAFAAEMWEFAKAGGDWPANEPGFLVMLRAWLVIQMAKEREV